MKSLLVVKALLRNLVVLDPDCFMEDEPELRTLVTLHDGGLRDQLEEEAEERDEYLDDDELDALVASRRLGYWSEMLTDAEVIEVGVYIVEAVIPALSAEMVGFCEMIVSRQPSLAGPVVARVTAALESMGGVR